MTSSTLQTRRLSFPADRSRANVVRALVMTARRIENRLRPPERISWKPDPDPALPDDDASLFRRHVGETRPLKHDERAAPVRRAPRPAPASGRDDGGMAEHPPEPGPSGDVERGSRIEFSRPGLQRREIRRLRRGQHPVEDRLDLHGLFAFEAERAVLEFIDHSRARGLRCVCIIHGKGRSSPKGRPVLKAIVDRWLRRSDAVLAFCPAPENAGGTGAVHVLLRTTT